MDRRSIDENTRWQIIGLSKNKNKSNSEIARLSRVSRTTLKNFKLTNGVEDLSGSGRPSKLSLS
jgi:hypothetical protein